jgi:hypothetical protein
MNRVTFTESDCNIETSSVWLTAALQFADKIGLIQAFGGFKLKMKEINYTVSQKLLTIVASILSGCQYTSDINSKLAGETLSANILGMERFPDQSQINILLNRVDESNIEQLREIHQQLLMQNSQSVYTDKSIVVDFDQSGLIANGKTYELSKRLFP